MIAIFSRDSGINPRSMNDISVWFVPTNLANSLCESFNFCRTSRHIIFSSISSSPFRRAVGVAPRLCVYSSSLSSLFLLCFSTSFSKYLLNQQMNKVTAADTNTHCTIVAIILCSPFFFVKDLSRPCSSIIPQSNHFVNTFFKNFWNFFNFFDFFRKSF